MKKLIFALVFAALSVLPARAQLGTLQGFCDNGGVNSVTSGLPSSNFLQGNIPQCTVSIYYHDTTTLAPIFAGESSTGTLKSVQVTAGGSYSVCPTGVSFSGGGGSGATAAVSCTSGAVVSVAVTNPGSGYTTAPSVSFTGGTGSGASATATIVGDLTNPFTANVDGSWRAWAAIATGYDVTFSGGNSPNSYTQPRTVINVFPNAYGGTAYTIIEANGTASAPVSPVDFMNSGTVDFGIVNNQISATAIALAGSPTTNQVWSYQGGTQGWYNTPLSLTIEHNGTAVATQNLLNFLDTPTAGLDAGFQQVLFKPNTAGGMAAETVSVQQSLQMATTPPTTGQYTIVYPTSFTQTHNCQGGSATNTSALLNIVGGVLGECEQTIVWSFSAPANIPAGNITAVYPFVTVAGGGTSYSITQTSTAGGGSSPLINQFSNICDYGGMHQCTSGSSISSPGTNITTLTVTADVATDNGYLAPGASSSLDIPLVGAFVYYTGTPVTTPSMLNVLAPLRYNAASNTLGISLPFNALADFGAVNAYQVVIPYAYPKPGTSLYVSTSNANTSAAPTLLTTAQGGATQAWTIVGPRGSSLCSGDIANTSATGSLAHYVLGNDSKWYLQNPQACIYATGTTLQVANAGTTGTTANTLTKLTGAPSTAVIAATTDTSGIVGVTVAGAGTTGAATIQLNGQANLIFDGATTAGDYVQISSTTAGNGHDFGASCPTTGQVIGRVLTTNAAGGTYAVNLGPNGCGGSGGGTTTNALTANSTGGAAPGSTFNGSAAVTWDYHSFGAPGVSGTPTTGHCADWASANTLGDAGAACGSGSGGVTSLNTLTGALSLTSSNSSVTITPSGTSINLQTAANGIPYNPSTTAYVFTGSSINQDDTNTFSPAETVNSWTCNGTTCSVVLSAAPAEALTVGNWQNVSTMTGWFAVPTGLSTVDSGVGTFQIASVTNSTTFVFNYTTNTGSCASSCGTARSADYWGPYYAALNAPALAGHGQAYWRFAWASDCANTTTFTTKYGSIAGTPKYFIFNGAQNDLNNGDNAATLEGYLQACWQNAHNAGFTVIQSTIVPTGIGIPASTYQNVMEQVNYWLYTQGPNYTSVTATGTAAGKYWDRMINLDAFASNLGASGTVEGNSVGASYYFAERVNDAFWKKMGSISGPPPYTFWGTNSEFPLIDYWGGSSATIFRWLQYASQSPQLIIDTNVGTTTVVTPSGSSTAPLIVQNLANSFPGGIATKFTNLQAQSGSYFQLATGCNSIGLGTSNTNDTFGLCFVNTGPNATTNEFFISPGYTSTNNILPPAGIALTAGGGVWFPGTHAVAGTIVGSQHFNVDTTGKLIVAASDSGISTLVAGTVTVSTPEACAPGATCSYQLTTCVLGGTQGMLSVGTVTAGTSFVITSSSSADTSQVCWRIN